MLQNKNYYLSDTVKIISGGTPKTSISEYWNGDIPWLSVKDFNGDSKRVYESEKYITASGLNNSSTNLLQPKDVIISARGTVGELAQIGRQMAFNQSCYGLRANNKLMDSDYLYYLLKSEINQIKQSVHGSVFDTITRDTFRKIKVSLPPLPTQRRIAAILSSLDDKIENNRKTAEKLEEIAQAIFKRWFVDFEFPNKDGKPYKSSDGEMVYCDELGKEIPEGWECNSASSFYDITIGKTPPRKESGWFEQSHNHNNTKWVSIKDMGNSGTYIHSTTECITNEAVEKFNVKRVPKDTVLLSFKLTIGRVCITTEEMLTNEAIAHFAYENKAGIKEYTYLMLTNYNYASLGSTSSIAKAINSKIVKNMSVLMPSDTVLKSLSKTLSPMFDLILEKEKENIKLQQTRDALLPKLMSGEIEVKNVECGK